MLPLCDTPDRLVARLYTALRVDCGCCTWVRGVTLGAVLGVILMALVDRYA